MKLTKILENVITEKFDARDAIAEMQVAILSSGISETAADQMTDILTSMSVDEIKVLRQKFQSMSIEQYIAGGWKTFEEFFEVKGTATGTGRGELMAVMAIKGASSGGTEKKDLDIQNVGTYEVKEGPDTIRMAKSGFAGLFAYVDKIKSFYKLLEGLGVNDRKNDNDLLKKLNQAFNSTESAEKIFKVLTSNFRGDGYKGKKSNDDEDIDPVSIEDFFFRTKVAAELPPSVIQLHFDGFKILQEEKSKLLKNDDLLKNAKMLVKTKDEEPAEYWISADDAAELKMAKINTTVNIKKGPSAKKEDTKVFMYNLLELFNHPYTKNPLGISKDFTDRKNEYFSEIEGILCYETNNPEPFIGPRELFIVSGISQNMGKMRRRKNSDPEWIKNQS